MKLNISFLAIILPFANTASAAAVSARLLYICVQANLCYVEVLADGLLADLTGAHRTDCSSYAACTSTAPGATVTQTQTVTTAHSSSATTAPREKRGADAAAPSSARQTGITCATAVPKYAPDCQAPGAYSAVCSCFGITRSTQTVTAAATTTTTTITTTPPVPTLCDNAGLQWAYYNDDTPIGDPIDFDPAPLKTKTPKAADTTNFLGLNYGADVSSANFYGKSTQPTRNFALTHRGYIYAPETGDYTPPASNVDDMVEVWVGATAYSGFTKSNRHHFAHFANGGPGASTTSISLTGNTYNAFRLVYKNGPSIAAFNYTITSPSGMTIVSSEPNASGTLFLVRYSCDGTAAPRYPPSGKEA